MGAEGPRIRMKQVIFLCAWVGGVVRESHLPLRPEGQGTTQEPVFTRITALEFTTNTFELTLRKLVFIQKVRQYVI